jgi:hypothetical protein
MDLFPYGGFTFAILLTIAFLNTNMLVYKKEISETFLGGSDAATYENSNGEENEFVTNDNNNLLEPYVTRKGKRYRVINSKE